MKTLSLRLLALVLLAAAAFAPASGAPVTIGNKNLSAEKLTAATLKSIFLGKKVAWDGAGGRITLVILKGGPVAEDYLKVAVDMSNSSFNNHWRRLAMTGGGTAPKAFDQEEEVRKFVAETPGAIGFVDRASADATVVTLPIAP